MATDDLIAALTAVGRVDSHGSFSLDREKAREKLRTFQVAEPQRHALHLVALAVLKGATSVTITCDSDDLVVEFDGAPVTAEDLDDLYNSSFAAARDDVQRARQQLAVGLHAAMALNPRSVRLMSGSGATAVQLVARPGRPDEIGAPRRAPGGTRIHVKQRFRPGLVVRFARHLNGTLAEAVLLRERCVHASIPITLNGAAISGGLALPGGVAGVEGSAGPLRGVAGLRPGGNGMGAIRLVRHGVWICEEMAAHFPFGALAVVAHDGLLTDLSGQQVVHDDERRRCVELAEKLMTDAIAAALGPGEAVEPAPGLRAVLQPVWRGWPAALTPDSELGRTLARARVWPDVWGRPHTLTALRAEAERLGHLPLADAALALTLPPTDEIIVHRGDPHVDEVVALVFADRTRDVGEMLATRARTEVNRQRWRAQPAEPTLVAANYLLVAPFQARHGERRVTGQAGLRRAAGERCSLRVIVDGCELAELELDAPIAGVDAVISGDLAIAADFSGPARDGLFAACLVAWLGAARVLVEAGLRQGRLRWAPGPALQALLYGYTRALLRGDATRATLVAGGFADDALPGLQRELSAALPLTSVPEDMSEEPWMADAFTFTSASGSPLRLGALALALRKGMAVRWGPDSYEGHPKIAALVLRVDARGQDLLRWLFRGRVPRMAQDEYASLRAHAEFMTRPAQPLMPRSPGLLQCVTVDQDGVKVALTFSRLREAWLTASHRAQCQICHSGRPLAQVAVWMPVQGVHLAIAGDALTVGKNWDSVVPDEVFHATMLRGVAALPALVAMAVARAADSDNAARTGWRPGVLAALAASVPTPALRSAYARLYAASREEADGHYERLLALGAAAGLDALNRLLEGEARSVAQLCDMPGLAQELSVPLPTPAKVRAIAAALAEIRRTLGQVGEGSLLERVATVSPGVGALPLFITVDGAPVTLDEVLARARSGKVHILATNGDERLKLHLKALRADSFTRRVLASILDPGRVTGEPPPAESFRIGSPARAEPAVTVDEAGTLEALDALDALDSLDMADAATAPLEPGVTSPEPEDLGGLLAALEREVGDVPAAPLEVPAASEPAQPGPGELLLAAVHAELEALRRGHGGLLSGFNLDHVRAATGSGRQMLTIDRAGVLLDLAEPRVQRAIAGHADDRVLVDFLASRVFTALNIWRADITDADEAGFHARHLARLRQSP